ncbi:MAG: hypothetical protein ACJ8AD_19500 [Gemmatimonadaceae bacterium]
MADRKQDTSRTDATEHNPPNSSRREGAEPSSGAHASGKPQDDEDSEQSSASRPRGKTEDPDRTL